MCLDYTHYGKDKMIHVCKRKSFLKLPFQQFVDFLAEKQHIFLKIYYLDALKT